METEPNIMPSMRDVLIDAGFEEKKSLFTRKTYYSHPGGYPNVKINSDGLSANSKVMDFSSPRDFIEKNKGLFLADHREAEFEGNMVDRALNRIAGEDYQLKLNEVYEARKQQAIGHIPFMKDSYSTVDVNPSLDENTVKAYGAAVNKYYDFLKNSEVFTPEDHIKVSELKSALMRMEADMSRPLTMYYDGKLTPKVVDGVTFSVAEQKAYLNSLRNPYNLASGDEKLLPQSIQSKREEIESIELDISSCYSWEKRHLYEVMNKATADYASSLKSLFSQEMQPSEKRQAKQTAVTQQNKPTIISGMHASTSATRDGATEYSLHITADGEEKLKTIGENNYMVFNALNVEKQARYAAKVFGLGPVKVALAPEAKQVASVGSTKPVSSESLETQQEEMHSRGFRR